MKKKLFYPLLTLLIALGIALPGRSQSQTAAQPQYPYMKDLTLPSFTLLLEDSATYFDTKNIPSGRPIILMYFSPDCEHCQHQTEAILKDMDSLKHVRFVLLTSLPFDKMRNFYNFYKLGDYKNITMGRDYEFFFSRHFGSQYVPYLAIYDKHKKLIKTFDGGCKVSDLIQLTGGD